MVIVGRVFIVFVFGVFFFHNPGTQATAHPGNTADDGCHYCRTNCEQWGVPYDERHCHGGGGGSTDTTSPPTTSPPTTSPPTTSPPTTQAPSSGGTGGGTTGTTSPPNAAATSTTFEGDATPPDPPAVDLRDPFPDGPELVVAVSGEPRAAFEVTVASEPQVESGRLDSNGEAEVAFLVENGDHTVTVVLEDADGNASEPVEEAVTVDIPAPSAPTAEIVSPEGESPVVVRVTNGVPHGRTLVRVGDEEQIVDFDEDGEAEATFEVDDGDHDVTVESEDFQGQRSEPIQLAASVSGDDEGSTIEAVILLVALALGGFGFYRWRRARPEKVEEPPPPAPATVTARETSPPPPATERPSEPPSPPTGEDLPSPPPPAR